MNVAGSGPVSKDGYAELKNGVKIRLSKNPHGRLTVVQTVGS